METKKKLSFAFVDLEKASKAATWWAVRKMGVEEWLMNAAMVTYEDATGYKWFECVFQLLPPPPPSSLAAAKSRMVWRSCTGLAYTGCPQNWPLYECSSSSTDLEYNPSNCHFWHATQDCVAPYADHNLQIGRFWAISIASGSVRLWDLRSCCIVILHQPCDAGASSWSPPVLWRESW